MVYVGAVKIKPSNYGHLAGRVGQRLISSTAQPVVPLKLMLYSVVDSPNNIFGWPHFASGRLQHSSDSKVKIDCPIIKENTHLPGLGGEATLLLMRDQLSPDILDIFRVAGGNISADFEKYCEWVVLLPHLTNQGQDEFGFNLIEPSITASKRASFVRGISNEDIQDLFGMSGRVYFINPYFQCDSSRMPFSAPPLILSAKMGELLRSASANQC